LQKKVASVHSFHINKDNINPYQNWEMKLSVNTEASLQSHIFRDENTTTSSLLPQIDLNNPKCDANNNIE